MKLNHHKIFQASSSLTEVQKKRFSKYGILHFKNLISRKHDQIGFVNVVKYLAIYRSNSRAEQSLHQAEKARRWNIYTYAISKKCQFQSSVIRTKIFQRLAKIKFPKLLFEDVPVYID